MKNKKVTLWVIIILLIILLPITIFSSIMHFKNTKNPKENTNHELKYNGKLYFYDQNQLLGTYTCQNPDGYCDYALMNNNSTYSLEERKVKSNTKFSLIDKRYAFIMDSKTEDLSEAEIKLYDLNINKVLTSYQSVKNYDLGIEGNYYIIQNENGKWGVIAIENDNLIKKIDFIYDYIGLVNKETENKKISSEIFAVLKDGIWQLIDINNAVFTTNISAEIFSYNSEYIVLQENNSMRLIDYKNNPLLNNYKYINFYNKFLTIIDSFNEFYLYDLSKRVKVSQSISVNSIDDIELKIVDNKIQILKDNSLVETIAIE